MAQHSLLHRLMPALLVFILVTNFPAHLNAQDHRHTDTNTAPSSQNGNISAIQPAETNAREAYATEATFGWESKISPLLLAPMRSGEKPEESRRMSTRSKTRPTALPGRPDAEIPNRMQIAMSDVNGERYASAFVQITPGTDARSLPGFSLRRVSPDGTIALGRVRIADLPELAAQTRVRRIQPAMVRRPLHQNSRIMVGADKVHAGIDLPAGYKGQGVIMGVIDSGIDFTNPDFSRDDGTRLLYLAEFTSDDRMLVWDASEINTSPGAITQKDGIYGGGHGTHVTGTAAGGGRLNAAFTGMAPESDIIFVKGIRDDDSDGGFEDGDLIEGIAFIFEKADELGRAAVVNLSLGGHDGPLDGTSLFEQFITQLTGPGRIVVAAAGNAGYDFLHAGAQLTGGERVAFLSLSYDDIEMYQTIWADNGAVASYTIAAYVMDDSGFLELVASTPSLNVGTHNLGSARGIRLYDTAEEAPAGFVYHDSRNVLDPNNGDTEIVIQIYDGYTEGGSDYAWIDEYIWAISLRATATGGRFDAYADNGLQLPYVLNVAGSRYIPGDRLYSVGSPASSREVISVGAYTSTVTWTNDGAQTFSLSFPSDPDWSATYRPQVGEAAYFSSRGPTRDGRVAPAISAPGTLIFSTRARNIPDIEFGSEVLVSGGAYNGSQGTSMASPHVAGIVALMLQVNPTLDYTAIMNAFSATSDSDVFTQAQPQHVFGVGKVNAHEAVKRVYANFTSIDQDERFGPATVTLMPNYPNPFNPATAISFELSESAAVTLEVFDMLGRRVAVLASGERYPAGTSRVTFASGNLSSGVYLYRLQVPDLGAEVSRTMMLVK